MAKSKKTKKSTRDDEKAAAAKRRKAEAAAAAKARAKAESLAADAKKARKAADKAVTAAEKAEARAADAARASGGPGARKPDELSLAKLALRAAEAKLTATEHRLEQVQQQLDAERRMQDEAVQLVLEDAVVDAAVEATVDEAIAEALVETDADPRADEAVVVEAVAMELDADASRVALPDEQPDHGGDAAAAAEVFAEDDEGSVTDAPPLPAEPDPGEPSERWTLLQLRAEAKRRGLPGTSNLPKAALLDRLRQG